MAGRTTGLRNRKSKSKVDDQVFPYNLDYHEGLSYNQVKVILYEFGFDHKHLNEFNGWMCGQTAPVVQRHNRRTGKVEQTGGIYEYDLFRWISSKKKGTPLIFD